MEGREITLAEILSAREYRAAQQQQLLGQFGLPLICFTMNIPGPIKNTPLIQRGFSLGCSLLKDTLHRSGVSLVYHQCNCSSTGTEGFFVADTPANHLKAIATHIEDTHPLGRLFDMDVLDTQGKKIDRATVSGKSRDCIICGTPGRGCASRRIHSVPELQSAVIKILTVFFTSYDAQHIGNLAADSLIEEVSITPKPGLVDQRNSGSHKDMNRDTFLSSAEALRPYFQHCVKIGQETASLSPTDTFPLLRKAGLEAENAMYQATGGVNTHKGAIFTFGLLCGSIGRLWKPDTPIPELSSLLAQTAAMAKVAVLSDFSHPLADTAGLQLYRSQGLRGIRGEVAAGLSSVTAYALPVFQQSIQAGYNRNDAGILALLHLIDKVEDTNLYHRGGAEGVQFARESVKALLASQFSLERVKQLDDAFISRNLSPGGCADLLAVTCFLDSLKTISL